MRNVIRDNPGGATLRDWPTMHRDDPTGGPVASRLLRRTTGTAASVRVHLTVLRGLPEVLEGMGMRCDPILAAAGLKREDLSDYDRTDSLVNLDDLLGACSRQAKCPHLGLLVGQHIDLQALGIPGRLARNAATIGAGLRDLVAYFALHDNGGAPSVAIHEGTASLAYGIHTPGVRNSDQVYDLVAAALRNIMCQLGGPRWAPDLILLPRRRPADTGPYREILGTRLRFDGVQCAIVFPATWLHKPIADADPLLHSVLEQRAASELGLKQPLLLSEVRCAIRLMLREGQHARAELAERLGMHERTLGRRLQQSGTTFHGLLEEARADVAKQLLRDTRSSVARVSAALGYRDPTIFTRAFRRWSGVTPRQYRAGLTDRD
jgi:AraC-like DNA-binding protein